MGGAWGRVHTCHVCVSLPWRGHPDPAPVASSTSQSPRYALPSPSQFPVHSQSSCQHPSPQSSQSSQFFQSFQALLSPPQPFPVFSLSLLNSSQFSQSPASSQSFPVPSNPLVTPPVCALCTDRVSTSRCAQASVSSQVCLGVPGRLRVCEGCAGTVCPTAFLGLCMSNTPVQGTIARVTHLYTGWSCVTAHVTHLYASSVQTHVWAWGHVCGVCPCMSHSHARVPMP